MMTPTVSSGAERPCHRLAAGRVLRENGIEVIGEYLENLLVWVELTGGARGPVALGSGLRTRPRFP
jgi:hypothetical protein